ncbi:MAG: hypothetical protein H0X37_20490 [Herpetosiphonaceae bacterium]|nr:hypothetical protein [Herpetosiphonaceae bacterium]
MNETLQQAMSLARSGQIPAAAELLHGLVEREPANGEAWLWLAGLTADPSERLNALNRVLAINPADRRAQQGIEGLRQQHPELFATPAAASIPQFFGTPAPSFTATAPLQATALPTTPSPGAAPETAAPTGDIYTGFPQPISTSTTPAAGYTMPRSGRGPGASIYDAPTLAQPVIPPPPVQPPAMERRLVEVAPAVPVTTPTAQMPAVVVTQPRRNPVALVARVLLALLWLVLTALLVLTAALALRYAQQAVNVSIGLPQVLRNITGTGTFSSSGGSLQTIGIISGILGVLGAIITLGMVLRWRIALVLSLLVGFLVAVAGVIIGVIAYAGGEDITGVGILLQVGDKAGGIIIGVLLLWPLLLAFVAWSEFSRRRQTV